MIAINVNDDGCPLVVMKELKGMQLRKAARVTRSCYGETPTHPGLPHERCRRIRINKAIERLNREMRKLTRMAGSLPDGRMALMLITARPKYVAESEWDPVATWT